MVVVNNVLQKIKLHKGIASLCCIIVYIVIAQLLYRHMHKNVEAQPTKSVSTFSYHCAIQGSEDLLCLQNKYHKLTVQKGVKAAFDQLKAQYQTDSNVKADCHQLTHVIGRTEADIVSNVDTAYSQGDNFCWSGYYHGVMESIIKQIGYQNLEAKLPTICANIARTKPYSFYHYNCVHGLGHGIMDVTDSDLFGSLKMCDLLKDNWEAQSCYGGVFMENVMDEVNPDHHSVFFKSDQPMYPCTAVADHYKEQCYLMQTSHALSAASEDFSKVFAECAAIEPKYVDTCYQSLGRDSSGNSNSTIGPTKAHCMLGKDFDAKSNCIIGAVKDFISYYHSDTQATQLCQSLDTVLQPICQSTKVKYYSTF